MELDIKNIKNETMRNIVSNYDNNNDRKLNDKECSQLVFDFDKYVTDENRQQMTDEFKKVVAKVSGGNRPDLIAQHMDRAEDNEEGKIYAETWNLYAKLYNGNTIKKFITLDNATQALEKYGVGTEEFAEEADEDTNNDKEPSFFQRNGKKILKIGAIVAGACVAALLLHKVGSKIINQQKAQASLANAAKEAALKEEIYSKNYLNAFKSTPLKYGTEKDVYGFLQNECYDSIRYCRENPYALRESCTTNIGNSLMQKRNDLLEISFGDGWVYKKPIHMQETIENINTCERLSLNVYPERELIKKLDNFLINSDTKAYYKAASEDIQWTIRHEPVVMYFPEKISPETEKSLIELILPHTRESAEGTMLGTKLATGIYKEAEPTAEEIAALIKRAEDLDFNPNLIKYLKSPKAGLYNKYGNVNSSPAMVKSVELLLDKLEALKVNV